VLEICSIMALLGSYGGDDGRSEWVREDIEG